MQFSADISSLVYVMPDVSIDDYYTYTDFISYFNCDDKSFNNFDDIHIQQLKRFDKLLEKTDNDFELYKERGDLKSEMGLYDEAVKDYEKALELNPNYEEAKNAIEKIKNDKINLINGENLLKIKAVSHLLKLIENEIFNNGKSITGKYLKLKEITDNISNFSDNLTEFDKVMEEFINEVINNNIKFGSKEANKIIQNIYENYINIININIDDPEIELVPKFNKKVHDLYGGVTAWNYVNIPAPSYKEGMIKFVTAGPKSGKTSVLCNIIAGLTNLKKCKVGVICLMERAKDAEKFNQLSQDKDNCIVYSLAWNNPKISGLSNRQILSLFDDIFDILVIDPSIDYIIIDSLTRLYSLIEGSGIGEEESAKDGGQKDSCRNYIRDKYLSRIEVNKKSLIATLLLEGKGSLANKIATNMKGLGNSDLVLDDYLLSKKIYPPINKRYSSTRDLFFNDHIRSQFTDEAIKVLKDYEEDLSELEDYLLAALLSTNFYVSKKGHGEVNSPLNEKFEFRDPLNK